MRLFLIFIVIFSNCAFANELSQAHKVTKTPEYIKMKKQYEKCVLRKGIEFVKVSSPSEAIQYAPIACKRELLTIKQFFLGSAFKTEVINALVQSVKEGVEIDLVNSVYKERLKYF
ncbi:hypothetical protein [Pseudoalteromonas denitrificans]|jgi:hypothetical protein|uniref:Uncharacterized protein n=1 Tax=Pseudoalteromonas denitrificans DSM 6059 TaxID=1123010 RepID=A0A1I1FHM9_9GAMM|nr:hypothetical protein [Pseudoalteromonas denitrificans]SFB98456.1 hypothetical protein SAMN02745724_00627 [Pseudoalteromonas denitrificans DSM 6059]